MILQEQIIEEIKQIPSDKLVEVYELIHTFRLKTQQHTSETSFASRWQGRFKLGDAVESRLDYLKQRYRL